MTDYQWWDCSCGFKCPDCGKLMTADGDDWSECECGARYIIDAHLYMAKNDTKIKLD